jgi:hypothetical protein
MFKVSLTDLGAIGTPQGWERAQSLHIVIRSQPTALDCTAGGPEAACRDLTCNRTCMSMQPHTVLAVKPANTDPLPG